MGRPLLLSYIRKIPVVGSLSVRFRQHLSNGPDGGGGWTQYRPRRTLRLCGFHGYSVAAVKPIFIPLLFAAFGFAQNSSIEIPAPFSATPAELQALAQKVKAPEGVGAKIVFDDTSYSFDAKGRMTHKWRRVFQVLNQEGVKDFNSLSWEWMPWHESKPVLKARVITKDGAIHYLDPKTIAEGAARDDSQDIYSDERVMRAPLPAIAPGAIVEQLVEMQDTAPFFEGGTLHRLYLSQSVPVGRSRLRLEAPTSLNLQFKIYRMTGVNPVRSEGNGISRVVIDAGPFDAVKVVQPLLPPNAATFATVDFSVGKSWRDLASRYAVQVDSRLQSGGFEHLVKEAATANTREEKIAMALARLHKEVRYTGVEFGEAALVPHQPKDVLERHYGDCKDKATLLVGMLRKMDIPAYVALLRTGPSLDIDPGLVGMGMFNHAIAYVPGSPDYWIDATAEFAPLGELPTMDRNRWAIIIRPDTEGPIKTPALTSARNVTIETREFYLAEIGKARLVETTQYSAHAAIPIRSNYASPDPAKLKKDLEGYLKTYYGAEKLTKFDYSSSNDLKHPFRLTLESDKVQRGMTYQAVATVAIFPANIMENLPAYFRDQDEEGAPVEPRRENFVISSPFVTEWRYKIVPPAGFKTRKLPENSKLTLGPATLGRQFETDKDGVVMVMFRFDSGKAELTPAEANSLRDGVKEFAKGEPVMLNFDQTGELLLSQGKAKEALAEWNSLLKIDPKNGLSQARISRALLACGLGAQARKAAEAATKLQPESAEAWRNYGWILQHDMVGRWRQRGFALEESIRAYRKARELAPTDFGLAGDLGILLEHDAMGFRYSPKARLNEAIEVYKEAGEKLELYGLSDNLAFALLYAGRYDELVKHLESGKATANHRALKIAVIALKADVSPAVAEGAKITSDADRRAALALAGNMLLRTRSYQKAAELLTASAEGSPNGAVVLNAARIIAGTKKLEELNKIGNTPIGLVLEWMTNILGPEDGMLKGEDPEETGKAFERQKVLAQKAGMKQGLSGAVILDIGFSAMQITSDGDDALGHRVKMRFATEDGAKNETFFVFKENGKYKLGGSSQSLNSLVPEILRRAEKGNLAGARKLLDWARELVERGGGDDPLAGGIFPRLWERGTAAGVDAIRAAAASLDTKNSLELLKKLRAKATDPNTKLNLDLAVGQSAILNWVPKTLLDASRRMLAVHPNSERAFTWEQAALIQLQLFKEANEAIEKRLKRLPDDAVALRAAVSLSMAQDQWQKIREYSARLEAAGKESGNDLNNLAWSVFVEKGGTQEAIQHAQKGLILLKNDFGLLHTLAAVMADAGRISEARDYLLQAMEAAGMDAAEEEMSDSIKLVLGVTAQHLGLPDAAKEYYSQMKPAKNKAEGGESSGSSYSIAQKRLKSL